MQRFLIAAGIFLLIAGLSWPWISHLGFGRLPGDIVIQRQGIKIYIPLATCLAVSVVLTLLFWFLRK